MTLRFLILMKLSIGFPSIPCSVLVSGIVCYDSAEGPGSDTEDFLPALQPGLVQYAGSRRASAQRGQLDFRQQACLRVHLVLQIPHQAPDAVQLILRVLSLLRSSFRLSAGAYTSVAQRCGLPSLANDLLCPQLPFNRRLWSCALTEVELFLRSIKEQFERNML